MSNKYEATFHPSDGPTYQGAREALVEQMAEALQRELGCFERESVTNGEHYCGKHRHLWLDRRGCQDTAIAARAVLPLVAAQVEAAVSVVRARLEASQGALSDLLTEHRVWVEALTDAMDRAAQIQPQGDERWVESGVAMRTTVLREVQAALDAVDAPTIEARAKLAESAEADLRALREGLEALAVAAEHGLPVIPEDCRALLASSPTEGTGEACHCGCSRIVLTPSAEDGA